MLYLVHNIEEDYDVIGYCYALVAHVIKSLSFRSILNLLYLVNIYIYI